jgi:dTDP-4-dehydrorhamnose reductase
MRVMVTGAGGMTGAEVSRQTVDRGWECVSFTRDQLDITDAANVARAVSINRPDIVVNAAAYTAVDDAESDEAGATLVNAGGAKNIADAAREAGAMMIHISTDYLFDGTSRVPYKPDDAVSPLGAYGRSKLAGEIAVRDSGARHLILRTSWVYSHEGRNFVRTMLRLGNERPSIDVVNDQHGSPTSAHDLARAILDASEVMQGNSSRHGTYHFCNANVTTWYEFAKEIFRLRGGDGPVINPTTSDRYRTAARRPAWSVLDCSSFETDFGINRRPWQQALGDVLAELQ